MNNRVSQTHEPPASEPNRRVTRRAILRGAFGLAGVTLLAACGSSAAPTATTGASSTAASTSAAASSSSATSAASTSAASSAATTSAAGAASTSAGSSTTRASSSAATGSPVAVDGKIPSPAVGVPDAYLKAPTPFRSYDGVPGKGGKVSVFTIAYQSPPPPRDQNKYWQELEKRLGITWDPIITPQPNYGEKSAALLAGGNLPELFYLNPGQNATPQYKAMDQGAFLDLTPFVTGDALKQYKNLATFPDYMWNNVKFKGKIYGVPKPNNRNGNIPYYRADWTKKLGITEPKSPTEVHDLLVSFAKKDPDGDGQADTWGMGRYGTSETGWDNTLVFNMFGTPFNWRKNSDGTLTNQIETDEFHQSVDFLRQLFADGAYHPDAGGMTFAQAQTAFISGKTGLHSEGIGNFYSPDIAGTVYYKMRQANPKVELAGLMPSDPGGSKAVTYNTQGSFGFVGIPASVGKDQNRVQELLRILDYLAAPFGSEEWHFLNYGVEGVDYKEDAKGIPVRTDQGNSERGDLVYVMGPMPYLYYPQTPEVAAQAQQIAYGIIKIGQDDLTWPLYSPTFVSKSAELRQFGFDSITAIITGRQPLSALDTYIKDWKSRGGDQIRKEYEQALKG
jgi:putative aldouronate transport system substrate-binding protein